MTSLVHIAPHAEAAALIAGKPAVTRAVFDTLLPELRGRAFTVTGIEDAGVLQRVRDTIADLPRGETWEDVKQRVADQLAEHLGEAGAERRATLLLRTHGFQAFQASAWRVAQEDEDTTHLQYLATEDTHVRDSHLALNGLILPKGDAFWNTHLPPWDWGCRCRVRPINPDLLAEAKEADANRAPEDQLVMEGAVAEQLRNGTLMRDGRRYDVTPPAEQGRDGTPFQWHPDNLRLPLEALEKRHDAATWATFKEAAQRNEVTPGVSVWEWLKGKNQTSTLKPDAMTKKQTLDTSGPLSSETAAVLMRAETDHEVTRAFRAYIGVTGDSEHKHINTHPQDARAQTLTRFIKRLPTMNGSIPLHRGFDFDSTAQRSALLDEWRKTKIVTVDRTFYSTSKSATEAAHRSITDPPPRGVFIVIRSHHSARDVEPLVEVFAPAMSAKEKEAVFLSGTKFRVVEETSLDLNYYASDGSIAIQRIPRFVLEEID